MAVFGWAMEVEVVNGPSISVPKKGHEARGRSRLAIVPAAGTSSLLKQDCTEQGVLAKPNLSAFGNFNWPGFT